MNGRDLDDEATRALAEGIAAYLAKPGNRGVSFLLDSKGLAPADRRAVLVALNDLEDETA